MNSGVLERMVERLLASMANGPAMNCRPGNSRQRLDWKQLEALGDVEVVRGLMDLLGPKKGAEFEGQNPPKKPAKKALDGTKQPDSPSGRQDAVFKKLKVIVDDARTYEQDTGVHALYVGFPLLSLPPGALGVGTRRILAPVAFIPVSVALGAGVKPTVRIECRGDGIDRVVPNEALLAWLEGKAGKSRAERLARQEEQTAKEWASDVEDGKGETAPATGLYDDEKGEDPWREIAAAVRYACGLAGIEIPTFFSTDVKNSENVSIVPAARAGAESEDEAAGVLAAAVVGLYPLANQGLLRDTEAMGGEEVGDDTPAAAFLDLGKKIDARMDAGVDLVETAERLVSPADPCQAKAVKLARVCRGLVVHGPPGTGKSQTITNIIGDHLARGERVLFVCDKRTALDVVANRLEHLGLGSLCAVVHDPQRDQRELYRSIREQLEQLAEVNTHPRAADSVGKIDVELAQLHCGLTHYHGLLHASPEGRTPLHVLVGQWLARGVEAPANATEARFDAAALADVDYAAVEKSGAALTEIFTRARHCAFATNPWTAAAGVELTAFLAQPMDHVRQAVADTHRLAVGADATADAAVPAFERRVEILRQQDEREELAGKMESLAARADEAVRARWSTASLGDIEVAAAKLESAKDLISRVRAQPLNAELARAVTTGAPSAMEMNLQAAALAEYVSSTGSVLGFLAFGKKSAAGKVLARYGLTASRANAERVLAFLREYMLRPQLAETVDGLRGKESGIPPATAIDDVSMLRLADAHAACIGLIRFVSGGASLTSLARRVAVAMRDEAALKTLGETLRRGRARAAAIAALETDVRRAGLIDERWAEPRIFATAFDGHAVAGATGPLVETLASLEDVLRVRKALADLPAGMRAVVEPLVGKDWEPGESMRQVKRAVLGAEISRRLREFPDLLEIDSRRMETTFARYRELEGKKMSLVRDAAMHGWVAKQKERLLAGTGTRLNGTGADVRRRLTSRGRGAMRLRQVLAFGAKTDGGDPLFDLRPVWMASPETVAQLFERKPIFDVVIFDEASQLRLEEAIPVLTRGKRVVIAGDQKQLPPTRFFESAAVATDDDEEIESDQALFESQQGDTEDLLAAALGLSIEESYLDVHYRSRNADLIGFSNEHFYGSRLQAIPGRKRGGTPMVLHAVGGVYRDRANEKEAEKVAEIVAELLGREKTPSIGVACFNLVQRDLIQEKLDERATGNADFAAKLAAARERQGAGSFEGLFVKNLENVQGDERDVIIISTTYGPDEKGKFRKNFGPLTKAGGGRRLNVLVTRARETVYLVTSIPREVYTALPPTPAGMQPTGAWLLFAYLQYAERVGETYRLAEAGNVVAEAGVPRASVGETRSPSVFVESLAAAVAKEPGRSSAVYWGNDGFGIDLVLEGGEEKGDGVLVDTTRFAGTDDPVRWEIFRSAIHAGQGWRLRRVWTPHFFRDPAGRTKELLAEG